MVVFRTTPIPVQSSREGVLAGRCGVTRRGGTSALGVAALLLALGCQHERTVTVSVDGIDSDSQFDEEVLRSNLPVVVDFGASWCGPCHMMEPVVADLAAHYEGRATVKYVDVDEVSSLAQTYEIHALPTFVFFQGGKEVGREIGMFSYEDMRRLVERYLPEADAPIPPQAAGDTPQGAGVIALETD
ncbi:MAG: thioredoxin family protein [Planctomycetaceae bacterium]